MNTSNSAIQTFKQCRRLYQMKYVYGLEPVQTAPALERGLSYHAGVEKLLRAWANNEPQVCIDNDIEDPKIRAMVFAFGVYIIPKLAQMCVKVNEVEKWFEYNNNGHCVVGRMDATTTGHCVLEHKTTSGLIDGAYLQRVEFDEQIPTYLLANGSNKVYYTVCATPSIRQKKTETDDEFFRRCCDWYLENTEQKINLFEFVKSDDELKDFKREQFEIISEMERSGFYYRNPGNCNKWGRLCEYASICKTCDGYGLYAGFERRERHYDTTREAESGGGEG